MTANSESATGRTFDDDCIRIEGQLYSCRQLGLAWPPPEILHVCPGVGPADVSHVYVDRPGISPAEHPTARAYRQVSRSLISDDDRAAMTRVFRGAEYEAVRP